MSSSTMWSLLLLLLVSGASSLTTLEDVSAKLLHSQADSAEDLSHCLPLAFGDFNADKRTDVIATREQDRSKVVVLIAKNQEAFTLDGSTSYFSSATSSRLECSINQAEVLNVAPADFDGDGGLDLLVVYKKLDQTDGALKALVLWGQHDQVLNEHKLLCPEQIMSEGWHHELVLKSQPLVLDANGDNVADLFVELSNKTRGFYLFEDRKSSPQFVELAESNGELRQPHSNAFVDVSGDRNADLLVTLKEGLQIFENVGGDTTHFKLAFQIDIDSTKRVGQSALADFDVDGLLDLVFLLCDDNSCSLMFAPLLSIWKHRSFDVFQVLEIDTGEWKFDKDNIAGVDDLYSALTLRVGDVNLDGYPDLLARMKNENNGKIQMQILINANGDSVDNEAILAKRRAFVLFDSLMSKAPHSVMATFYDLYEDGLEDVIVVNKESNGLRMATLSNENQDNDAYFVKVIVLSGICYYNCEKGKIQVPYGTNLPGQTICYHIQRPNEHNQFVDIKGCASQLTQTAHNALQQPYTIFGLGMAPNFLDSMTVSVTNASFVSKSKSWPQIIPNSQMYVIPHPPEIPEEWQAKLFITPSRAITLTALALVGSCIACVLIILLLHWRERRQDHREKLMQANSFLRQEMDCQLEIPFKTARHAQIALQSLNVDPEPRRSAMTKTLAIKEGEDWVLQVNLKAKETKQLRVGVNGFIDMARLVVQTIDAFDEA